MLELISRADFTVTVKTSDFTQFDLRPAVMDQSVPDPFIWSRHLSFGVLTSILPRRL
jgi:hypothetical protein